MNRTLKPFLLAAFVLVGLDVLSASAVRRRWQLAATGLVFVVLLVRQREWLLRRESRIPVLVALLASFVPVFALGLYEASDRELVVMQQLLPTLIGWCVMLALALYTTGDEGATETADWKPTRVQGLLALAAVFVLLATVHYLAVGDIAFVADEVVYLTQSRWIRPGQWTASMDADIAPFFLMRQIGYLDGHLVGQYPAGWPMVLAAFRMVGLEWWSSVILGTASIALLYRLGTKLHSRRVGAIAALLLATSQQFLFTHAGYMAHAITITCLLGATLCFLHGQDRRGWPRVLYWAVAGLLLGITVAARPLTGLTAGMSVGLWMLARTWNADRRAVATMIGAVIVGGIVPAAFFIAHNVAVTGGPLVLGYDAIHGGLYHLGFGTHGYMVLDENVNRVARTFEFTPAAAVKATFGRLAGVNTQYLPIGLLMPVVAAALIAGYRIRWGLVAVFTLLPLAHFFYRFPSLRMYTELLPFLLLAVATMLMTVWRRWPSLAAGLVVMTLLSQIVVTVPVPEERPAAFRQWLYSDYGPLAPARRQVFASIDSLQRAHGRILVFSREESEFDNLIDRIYIYNGGDFSGPVLVARDRGERNIELIRRHPDRVPFLVIDNTRLIPATITAIDERD